MPMFSTLDYVALAWFIGAWAVYSITLSLTERRMQGLNSEMNRYRDVWMFQMLARDMRMVDAQIVAALQNGTAFFASTSLIAIGALVTLIPGLPLFQLLIVVQVVNCMLLPALLVFIVKLASSRSVMGTYRNGRTYNIFAWGTVIVIGSLATTYLLMLVLGPLVGIGANS